MCGIAGVMRLGGARPGLPRLVQGMTSAIRARGPDDEGYVFLNGEGGWSPASGEDTVAPFNGMLPPVAELDARPFSLGFGHRRFAILDLSPGGHQPYVDPESRLAGVFNGLIYNYLEVKAELVGEGVAFNTVCDTEVLFRAYRRWGAACFSKFNGTWAVALYDGAGDRLLLSRDRLGKKPLYMCREGGSIYFASEIKAIIHALGRVPEIDDRAVFDYLTAGVRDLHHRTFFAGIEVVPPGSVWVFDRSGARQVSTYWQVPQGRTAALSGATPSEVSAHLRGLLESAVAIRLRADVGVGIELSGGLDSSSVAALASAQQPGRLSAFTVGFPQPEWNEEPYARRVADHCRLAYHVVRSPERRFWDDVDCFVATHEEPFHSPNLHTQQLVWRTMHEHGIKVILYGTGGDEVFAGYRKDYFYPYLVELARLGRLFALFRNVLHFSELSPWELVAKFAHSRLSRERNGGRFAGLLGDRLSGLDEAIALAGGTAEERLYRNLTDLKMPYWLLSNDKNSMAIPTEVRAPLLDYRVVEFAFGLPLDLLMHNGWLKWILRKAVEDLLPEDITWRPKKMGYPFPLREWLFESRTIISGLLKTADNPYLDAGRVEARLPALIHTAPDLAWRVLCLELWHRRVVRGRAIVA